MRRSTILVALALLTAGSLGVATFALVRRHQVEAQLAELARPGRVAAPAASAARPPVMSPAAPGDAHPPVPSTRGDDPKTKPAARPDVGELFAAHPQLQAAYQQAVRGRLQHNYGRLFERLGLSPGQIEQAITLLVHHTEQELDLAMTAQTLQLPKGDAALQRFGRDEKSETEAKLESLLGPAGMQAWRDYNRALGMQSTAEDVASFSLATDTPLTGAQVEQLTRVLAEASASYRAGGLPEWSTTDWAHVVGRASTFLNPAQLAVLQAKIEQARAVALLAQFYTGRSPR